MAGFGAGDNITYPLGKFCPEDVLVAFAIGIIWSFPVLSRLNIFIDQQIKSTHAGLHQVWEALSRPVGIAVLAFIFIISVMGLSAGAYNPFIYFRF